MKKLWPIIVLLLVAGGIYFFTKKNSAPNQPPAANGIISENNSRASATPNSGGIRATSVVASGVNAAPAHDLAVRDAPANLTSTDAVPRLPPLTILDNARVVIHNYCDRFGENPVGNNAEITAALTGNNPKQVNFITAESGLRVNDNGELVDGYGTPFFFHQISGHEMEIHSAGVDRQMWTRDDQVMR